MEIDRDHAVAAPGADDPPVTEAGWRAMLEAVQGYLCIADAERRIQIINRPTVGREMGQFIGRDFADFVAPEQRAIVRDAARLIISGSGPLELETQGTESGRWFRARISGIHARGEPRGFVAHVLDVDDAKLLGIERDVLRAKLRAHALPPETDAAADDAQRRLELIADSLPVLISYVDRERRYQYNNAAYTRWFGTSQEALRGRTMPDVLGIEAYERIRGYVDAVLASRAVTFETTIPYQNAGVRRVIAHYVPDVTADGAVAGFFALVEDVTARRKAEDSLRQREDEVRQLQKMEALGRLAGGIAHDFNNLLQTIINCCAGALISLEEENPPLEQAILHMKRSAERGATMTRQLLAFSRDQELTPTLVDLDAVLLDMEFLLQRLIGSNIDVEFDRRANCLVPADAGQLQQVIMNLAINAGDAMPDGGTLRVETRKVDVTAEDVQAHPALNPGQYVLLTVADTGTGMDRDTMERVFEPFFTTKMPDKGSGLGLSMVYGIVQKLNGQIEVESELNEGTTFRIHLPARER